MLDEPSPLQQKLYPVIADAMEKFGVRDHASKGFGFYRDKAYKPVVGAFITGAARLREIYTQGEEFEGVELTLEKVQALVAAQGAYLMQTATSPAAHYPYEDFTNANHALIRHLKRVCCEYLDKDITHVSSPSRKGGGITS